MLMKGLSLTTVSFIVFILIGFSSKTSGQSSSDVTVQARTSALRGLVGSIEGIAREPPRTHKTKEGYLRFLMAPPSTHFPSGLGQGAAPKKAADAFLGQWRGLFVRRKPPSRV